MHRFPSRRTLVLATLLLFNTFMGGFVMGEDIDRAQPKVLGLYGVNLGQGALEGKSAKQAAQLMQVLGANAVFGGYESEEFVSECRKREISVYASQGIFVGEKYWKSHPECRPINAKGQPIAKVDWYAGVCPNQKWLRNSKLEAIREKAKTGLMDGIWLDFIRYPVHWEDLPPKLRLEETCFCQTCLDKFQTDCSVEFPAGVDSASKAASLILQRHSEQWYHWRCQQISDFVREASETLHSIRPEAKLGMFTVPWLPKDYENSMHRIVGQDLKSLAPHVDVFSPMVYHKLRGEKPEWVAEVTKHVSEQTGKAVWPIIQVFSEPDELSDDEFESSANFALQPPSSGVILFSFGHIQKEGRSTKVGEVFGRNN